MVYKVFLETIVNHFQKELGNDYQITLRQIPKNNGILLDGLCISKPNFSMSPAIYLNPYYEQYQSGMTMNAIICDIRGLYYNTSIPSIIKQVNLSDFSSLQHRIMFKLIHAASNQELLHDIPHISYLDLAIVFYLHLEQSDAGQMTALIHKEHLKCWNVRTRDLWQYALLNTPSKLPARIRPIDELIEEISDSSTDDGYHEEILSALSDSEDEAWPLYVLTNPTGLNGACCMLYRDVLKNFANTLHADLIVLPSSIHEVLITPNHIEASYDELSQIVTLINQTEVSPEDHLSNQVYLYTRADDRIRIMSHALEQVGNHKNS